MADITTVPKYRRHTLSTYYNPNWGNNRLSVYAQYNDDLQLPSTRRVTNKNPSWRILVSKRQDAGSAYLRERTEVKQRYAIESGSFVGYGAYKGYFGYFRGYGMTGAPSSFTAFNNDAALRDLALTRLKKRLKREIGSADLAAPIAEIKEVKQLAKQVVLLGVDLMKSLIDIKRTKGKSAFKYAADVWLGFNFAAKPLDADIRQGVKSIKSYFDRSDKSVRLSASAKRDWVTSARTTVDETFSYHASLRTHSALYHQLSYRYYAGGILSLESDTDYGLLDHTGLTLDALLPTLWELQAFSWAGDYFANIGVFLDDAFWAPPGLLHYSGYTRKYTCSVVITPILNHTGSYYATQTVRSGVLERHEFERVPLLGTLPHIGLHFRSVDEVGKNAVTKLLNLASVLVQRKR